MGEGRVSGKVGRGEIREVRKVGEGRDFGGGSEESK